MKKRRKNRKIKKIDPLKYALRLLKIRARSIEEIRRKMKNRGYSGEEIENVLSELKKMNFVDDSKFSYLYAYDRLTVHKRGPILIRMELKNLGVEDHIIEQAMEKLLNEVDEDEVIVEMIRKWENLERNKIVERLVRRGFDRQKVLDLLNSFFEK